jgi:hypothetical protein
VGSNPTRDGYFYFGLMPQKPKFLLFLKHVQFLQSKTLSLFSTFFSQFFWGMFPSRSRLPTFTFSGSPCYALIWWTPSKQLSHGRQWGLRGGLAAMFHSLTCPPTLVMQQTLCCHQPSQGLSA